MNCPSASHYAIGGRDSAAEERINAVMKRSHMTNVLSPTAAPYVRLKGWRDNRHSIDATAR